VRYLDRYKKQIETLKKLHTVKVIVIEGDSVDGTWEQLLQGWEPGYYLFRMDCGTPKYGSVVNAERFQTLAKVCNAGLNRVDYEWAGYVLMLPIDMVYGAELVTRLAAHDKDMIAPFVWEGDRFYDTWAFSGKDQRFTGFSQEYARNNFPNEPIEMQTIGGTVLAKAKVFESGVRYSPENVDRGMSEQARRMGYTVWADPTTHVFHEA